MNSVLSFISQNKIIQFFLFTLHLIVKYEFSFIVFYIDIIDDQQKIKIT